MENKMGIYKINQLTQCIIAITLSSLLFCCCNEKTILEQGKYTPREFKWSLDTIEYPSSIQTLMRSIWGNSKNNVYVAGNNARGNGYMYRFDGVKWNLVSLPLGAISLSQVLGFSETDIWAVGSEYNIVNNLAQDSSLILHYDGISWSIKLRGGTRGLFSIGGSKDNLWIGGINKLLYHYNGKTLVQDTLPNMYHGNDSIYSDIVSIVPNNKNEVYALVSINYSNSNYPNLRDIYKRTDNNAWTKIDSNLSWSTYKLWNNYTNDLIGLGSHTKIKKGDIWTQYLPFDSVRTMSIAAVSDNDIILIGYTFSDPPISIVYHFNGTNWSLIKDLSFSNVLPWDVYYSGKEIFIVCVTNSYPQKTIILRGD